MRQCCSLFVLSLFVLLTSSVLLFPAANAQTQASCTFKMFRPPTGFSGDFLPLGINHYNTVVGQANTQNQVSAKAFIRFSGGGISLFQPKGALYTTLNKRNLSGTSVGQYGRTMTGNNPPLSGTHGLIMTSKSFATLDFPAAGGTALNGINKSNVIVGSGLDTSTKGAFGFKHLNGTFSKIMFPHSVQTMTTAINDNGVIVGGYELDSFENPWSGYILQNGKFRSLSYIPTDINNSGTIVSGNQIHFANGIVKRVNVSGADNVFVNGVNDLGTITGAAHFGGTPGTWKGFIASCH
jgi:hypothetical protein